MESISEGLDPDAEPSHAGSWSADLEGPEHAASIERVVREALSAVEQTDPGVHVNLVTHADHGHPEAYLYPLLEDRFGEDVRVEYVDQCGCGGFVSRVHVQS